MEWKDLLDKADLIGIGIAFLFGLIQLINYLIKVKKEKNEFTEASKKLTKNIEGEWYSAELDYKQPVLSHAIIKVRVERVKRSNKVTISKIEQINKEDVNVETGWIVHGRIVTENTIISDWVGVIENTTRYGNAFLKFIENGRAIGYWIGYGSKTDGRPMYGYWILSRKEEDVKNLSDSVLQKFQFYDVKFMVEHFGEKLMPSNYVIKQSK